MKRSFLSRDSEFSGERIARFTLAYKGTRFIYGSGDGTPVITTIWLSQADFLIAQIKGSIRTGAGV